MLEISTLILGQVDTNTYIAAHKPSGAAVVIDPADDGRTILNDATKNGWRVEQIWVTHAHFDHIAGIKSLLDGLSSPVILACHADDRPLWQAQGGAPFFGLSIDPPPEPNRWLAHGDILHLGDIAFEVRHVPGHSPGHVVYYARSEHVLFCGDLLFQGTIGRTDLPGGDYDQLLASLHSQVFPLPGETRLFPGHGPSTTLAIEKRTNPFLDL